MFVCFFKKVSLIKAVSISTARVKLSTKFLDRICKMNRIKYLLNRNKIKTIHNEKNEFNVEKFITKYFVFAGVWKSEGDYTHNSIIAMLNLTVLIVGFLSIAYMFMLKYDDIDINTEILLHSVEIFHTICVQIMFIRKKDDIGRLSEALSITLDQMTLPTCIRDRCAVILVRERQSFLKVMKLAFLAIIVVYVSVIYDSNAFGVRGKRKLLYPTWFPFQTNIDHHIGLYYLAIAFQVLIYVELLFIDLAAVGLWYGTINAVSGILDILGVTFQSMTENHQEESMEESEENKVDLKSRMKTCVDLHNLAMDFVKILNSSFGVIFLEVVLTSEIAICFCGFHVIQSEEFYKSLYFCKWYQQSSSFKKSFYFCQTISKKALVVDGAQCVPADLHTFVKSMKGVFTFLNFLLAIKEKT